MMCVNDTLPPRRRRRWLLMTTRLSMSSLAGIARTLVATGTARLASMLATTRAAAPFNGLVATSAPEPAGFGAGSGAAVGLVAAGAVWAVAAGFGARLGAS